jgi:hypothetical protein
MISEEEDGQLRTGDNKGNRKAGKPVSYSPFPLLPSVLIISLGAIP